MPKISRQVIDKDGLSPTLANASSGGDTFECSGNEIVYVENTDASSHDVTIPAQKNSYDDEVYGNQDLSDIQVSIPSGEFRLIAGIAPAAYGKSDGEADINYSDNTGMKVAVLQRNK